MNITRLPLRLTGDPHRVIARSFVPGGPLRIRAIIDRVRALPEMKVHSMVATLVTDYRPRHKDISEMFRQNYATAMALIGDNPAVSDERVCCSAPTSPASIRSNPPHSSTHQWCCTPTRTA